MNARQLLRFTLSFFVAAGAAWVAGANSTGPAAAAPGLAVCGEQYLGCVRSCPPAQ